MAQPQTRLDTFNNDWYEPGASLTKRMAWMAVDRAFLDTSIPWPSAIRRRVLRAFGAKVGKGVVIRGHVHVKYPWNVSIGDHTWVGEGVWIDSLAKVTIGSHACLSQGCMIETGNHDWSKTTFDLKVQEVVVEDGAWAAVKSLLLPGSRLASHSVLSGGSVLTGSSEPYGIYVGVPAKRTRDRTILSSPGS